MRLLAVEAGGPVLSAALFDGGAAAGSAWLRAPRLQTERLAPLVRGLLGHAGWEPRTLGAFACGRGPGSFNGLRSSLAFGTGLGLAITGLRLVAVPTLAAWAEAFCPSGSGEALVLLDGRRSQVYRALLGRGPGRAGWRDLLEPALLDLDAALAEGRARPSAALVGDLEPGPPGSSGPRMDSAALAEAVGRLALAALRSPAPLPPWEPDYLRRSEAELLWERLHPNPPGAG